MSDICADTPRLSSSSPGPFPSRKAEEKPDKGEEQEGSCPHLGRTLAVWPPRPWAPWGDDWLAPPPGPMGDDWHMGSELPG